MPIFNDIKLVFVHIPKTAGTSIEKACFGLSCEKNKNLDLNLDAFELYDQPNCRTDQVAFSLYKGNIETDKDFLYYIKKHCSYQKMISVFPHIYDFKTFTVIRNPYDRVRSYFYYHYSKRIGFFSNHKVNLKKLDSDDYKVVFGAYLNEFLSSHRKIELKTQYSFLSDDKNKLYSNIILLRYENLTNDLNQYVPELSVSALPNITHRNKNIPTIPYSDLYTKFSKKLVYEHYKQDFKELGYEK